MDQQETQTERRYCEDCRFFLTSKDHSDPDSIRKFGRCQKMAQSGYHMVGRGLGEFAYCNVARQVSDGCGPEAKWFESKPALDEAAQ